MLDSAFVADESEPLIDQKASDRPGRHTVSSDERSPGNIPKVGKLRGEGPAEDAAQQYSGSADDLLPALIAAPARWSRRTLSLNRRKCREFLS
jgi:hypothetical protein